MTMVKRRQPEERSPERERMTRTQHEQENEDWLRRKQREHWEERIAGGETPWRDWRGIQSVMCAVSDVKFPTTREAIEGSEVGERKVRLSKHTEVPLREVVRKIGGGNYVSPSHFETTLTRNWVAVESIERVREPGEPFREPSP